MKLRSLLLVVLLLISGPTLFSAAGAKEGIHKRIDELILKKELDQAEKLALQAYAEHPNEAEAICALGCVYRNKAIRDYVQVDLDAMGIKEGGTGHFELPAKGLEKYFKGKNSYDRDLYRKAEEKYYEAISKCPTYTNAYFNLLNDYVDLNEFTNYFKVIALFITNLRDAHDTRFQLLDLGSKLYKNQDVDIDNTIRLYREIVKYYPDYLDAKGDLGAALMMKGDLAEALTAFKAVYAGNPGDDINLRNLFSAFLLDENFADAWPVAERLMTVDQNYCYATGMLALLLGRDAQPYFLKVAAGNKAGGEATKEDFWTTNARTFLTYDTLTPDHKVEFLQLQIEQFAKNSYLPEAILSCNLLQRTGGSNYHLVVLGSIYDGKNILSKTIKYLDLIAEARKKDGKLMREDDLYVNYGRIYLAVEQYDRSLPYLQKAFRLTQSSARLNYFLGLCELKLGNRARAIYYLKLNEKMTDKEQVGDINQSIRLLRKLEAE